MGGTSSMTLIATLKTNPTPKLIREILARAVASGSDAVIIHFPQTSEDEICFLCLLVEFPNLSEATDRTFDHDQNLKIL